MTSSSTPECFTWIAVGDHFDEPAPGLMDHMVAVRPAFVVGVGDLVFRSDPKDFAAFQRVIMEPLAAVGARFYPVIGNHDFPIQPHWPGFWEAPGHQPYYAFDHGGAHFVVLDTNRAFLWEVGRNEDQIFAPESEEYAIQTQAQPFNPGSAQYEWLRCDLAETTQAHVFVFFHEPAFTRGGHEEALTVQRHLCPLFEQYRVTAAFSGHSHGYERFLPLRVDLSSGEPVAVPDDDGVVYIVTGGGGKPIYEIAPDPLHAAAAEAFHFMRLEVDGDTVRGAAIEAATGAVLDAFAWTSRRR
jgi:acid phosphatase type 7